jgi:hypothetical protein
MVLSPSTLIMIALQDGRILRTWPPSKGYPHRTNPTITPNLNLINPIFPLNPLQRLLPLLHILLTLHHLLRLVIQHHQVPIHEIEPIQFIARLLRVGDFVVHDKRGALGGRGVALPDLADGAEFAEEGEEGGGIEGVGEVLDEEDSVDVEVSRGRLGRW